MAALAMQGAAVFLAGTSSAFLLAFPVASIALVVETKGDFETIANQLNRRGIKAQAPAAIVGKSGVKHEFAFALVPDSGKARVVVDTELSVRDVDEMKVLKFYVKVFDVGPEKAVLCVSPKLGARAATLAKEYGITVLEDDVPRRLIPLAEKVVNEVIDSGGN
jgi:hypothetical protein